MTFLLILAFLGVALFEVPNLIRNKHWRELTFFSAFLAFAFLLSLLQILNVELPNPIRGIQYLIKDILHLN
jgi:hypothetical protein